MFASERKGHGHSHMMVQVPVGRETVRRKVTPVVVAGRIVRESAVRKVQREDNHHCRIAVILREVVGVVDCMQNLVVDTAIDSGTTVVDRVDSGIVTPEISCWHVVVVMQDMGAG